MKQATEKENKVIKEKAAKNYSSAMEVYAVPVSSFEELMKRNDRIEEEMRQSLKQVFRKTLVSG